MNKLLALTVLFVHLVVGLAGCTSQVAPPPTATTPLPTSTPDIPTRTPAPTATQLPTASSTPRLLPISPEASAYLNEALNIIETTSLYRENIDWVAFRKDAFDVAKHAQTPEDTYGAIQFALSRLGDHHSSFLPPTRLEQILQKTASDNPAPRGKLLLEKIGYIALQSYQGIEGAEFATNTQQLIRELDAQSPCGWIVDLRENHGGNMWPMLTGIGPILGEGEAGAAIDSYGDKEVWSYRDGKSFLNDQIDTQVNGQAYRLKATLPPVAVLTSVGTASSGEGIAIAFRGRPNTRSFGLPTAGLTTGNSAFVLSDGAAVNITTAVAADRTGQVYGQEIQPDVKVDNIRQFTVLDGEVIPQPAIDWLLSQPACKGKK
jgi:C-terminal processing protease CtpA/Prc